jgi:5-methyltetrahydropteroyltriglutamate--homocysteine methyltransferase
MKIKASTHSSFPRIGEHPDEQKLRRATAGLEEGKISFDEFTRVQNELIDEIIKIQERAGIDTITDGLIRWYDPASHLAKNLDGFEINGLLRFFDTNFYFRQPVVKGVVGLGNGKLADEIRYTASKSKREVKAVMLGPLSMAAMSLNKSSLKFEELCLKLGEVLGRQADQLSSAGANIIQIEEPWLARNPNLFELFQSGFGKFNQFKGNARTLVTFYFGDINHLYNRLSEIPADMIGIDFPYSPGVINKILADGFPKPISFGILDGRNTKMENPDTVAKTLEPILQKINLNGCHITTSCGLEFLPRQYAIKKLELTAQITKLING